MDDPWIIHGLSMNSPWIIRRESIDNPWVIHGLSMEFLELSMDDPRIIHENIGFVTKWHAMEVERFLTRRKSFQAPGASSQAKVPSESSQATAPK